MFNRARFVMNARCSRESHIAENKSRREAGVKTEDAYLIAELHVTDYHGILRHPKLFIGDDCASVSENKPVKKPVGL